MDWFSKHVDTVVVLGAVLGSMIWMNGKFSDIDQRFAEIEKDIAVMKAVMIVKQIMPCELAKEQVK